MILKVTIFAGCLTQIPVVIEMLHDVSHKIKATLMMGKNKPSYIERLPYHYYYYRHFTV